MNEVSRTRRFRKPSRSLSFEQLETRSLLAAVVATHVLDDFSITGNVSENPESKIWQHAGNWWGVFSDTIGTHVWRLDSQTWHKSFTISDAKGVHVDAKPNGNVTHVLFRNNLSSQLYSLQYVPGAVPTYTFWNDRPLPASVQLSASVEAATIDIDSKGRMWVGYDDKKEIEVRYSDAPYSSWSNPVVLANNVKKSDIAALTALPNGSIGVLWSNKTTRQFGFRTHVDGTDPTLWTADEVPASQSALNIDKGFANNFINLAVASDATLYAAIKTGYSTAGSPEIGVLVRRPNGVWDDFHGLDALQATRPIIQLSETANTLILSYRRGSKWVYQECNATTITCSAAKLLLGSGVNATSTKQNVTSDLVILTSGKSTSGAVSGAILKFGTKNSVTTSFQDGVFPTAAYAGTRDTKLRAANPTTNYGKDQPLEVFERPLFTSLFQWDVSGIPKNATVLAASLTLNAETTSKNSYRIFELLGNWDETTATFLQSSKNVSWNTPGAVGIGKDRGSTLLGTIVSPKKGSVTVELNTAGTAVIQKWISDPASNHGLILQDILDPLLRNWVITSREGINPLTRPKLTISYASKTKSSPVVLNTSGLVINHLSRNAASFGEGEGISPGLLIAPTGVLDVRNQIVDNAAFQDRPPTTIDALAIDLVLPIPRSREASRCDQVLTVESESTSSDARSFFFEQLGNELQPSRSG